MDQLKTKTLWGIVVASGLLFILSPFIATPLGMLTDKILLSRFTEQWSQSHDPSLAFQTIALGENIFLFTTLFVAFIALVCGILAARVLYKRRNI